MAPVGNQLAGELPVPEGGRRDGVGVCVNTGVLLSTGYMVPVEVGREEKIGTELTETSWRNTSGVVLAECFSAMKETMFDLPCAVDFLFSRHMMS